MAEAVDRMEACFKAADYEKFSDHDVDFHESIAQATHNPLFMAISSGIHTVLRKWIGVATAESPIMTGARSHRPILEAIQARNCELAREIMQKHMEIALVNASRVESREL